MAQQHPKFPSFSDAISVQYDPQGVRGRYCVASRDIEPGELVAVETPFVWMLDRIPLKHIAGTVSDQFWRRFRVQIVQV